MFVAPIKLIIENYTQPINIGEFLVRKITTEEQGKFFWITDLRIEWNSTYYISLGSRFECEGSLSRTEYSKYITCEYVIETENIDYIQDFLTYLLFAFRIYKQGDVYAPMFFHSEYPWFTAIQPYFMNCDKVYTVDDNELWNVEQLFNKILEIQSDKRFQLILDRFNIAINKNTSKVGWFIDLISILESLLLPPDNWTELSFKFSLYGSYLLNKLWVNISYKELKELYNDRSKIVHWKLVKDFWNQYDRLYELTIILLKEYCNQNIEAKDIEKEIFLTLNIPLTTTR